MLKDLIKLEVVEKNFLKKLAGFGKMLDEFLTLVSNERYDDIITIQKYENKQLDEFVEMIDAIYSEKLSFIQENVLFKFYIAASKIITILYQTNHSVCRKVLILILRSTNMKFIQESCDPMSILASNIFEVIKDTSDLYSLFLTSVSDNIKYKGQIHRFIHTQKDNCTDTLGGIYTFHKIFEILNGLEVRRKFTSIQKYLPASMMVSLKQGISQLHITMKISIEFEKDLDYYCEEINDCLELCAEYICEQYMYDTDSTKNIVLFLMSHEKIGDRFSRYQKLIFFALEKFNHSKILILAIFYDFMTLESGKPVITDFIISILRQSIKNKNEILLNFFKDLLNIKEFEKNIYHHLEKKEDTISDITDFFGITFNSKNLEVQNVKIMIERLNFDAYWCIIQTMIKIKKPFIDPSLYNKVIENSFMWDNYMQVYLWKILLHQKKFLKIEVEFAGILLTNESKDGILSLN